MMNQLDERLQARQASMMKKSTDDVEFAIDPVLALRRRLSNVNSFRYSKELLCRMNTKQLGILMSCLMPLAKIDKQHYLVGAEKKQIVVRSDRVLIKGSTGFEELKAFIARYALSECLVIWRIMQQKNLSYRETVMNLLQLKGAKPKVVTKYATECSDDVSELFEVIATIIKQK